MRPSSSSTHIAKSSNRSSLAEVLIQPLALVVAAIRNRGELVDAPLCTGELRHRRPLITINSDIGNDVR